MGSAARGLMTSPPGLGKRAHECRDCHSTPPPPCEVQPSALVAKLRRIDIDSCFLFAHPEPYSLPKRLHLRLL